MTDPASEGRHDAITAITRSTHLSDYQLASVAFIVCIYALKITDILLNIFFLCLGSFCVTHILYDSRRICVCFECTQIFCLLFGWEQFPVPLTFFGSNIGLFHLIYKTVNGFMQSKPSHLNEPHQFAGLLLHLFDENKGIKTRYKE